MTFRDIQAGEKVLYRTPQGQQCSGRAQRFLLFTTHVVVDRGNGQPAVVNESNYVRHVARKGQA